MSPGGVQASGSAGREELKKGVAVEEKSLAGAAEEFSLVAEMC